MNTLEHTVAYLCNQVDYWKAQAEMWEEKYDEEIRIQFKSNTESVERGKAMIGTLLTLALNVKDDENGNIVVSREGRKAVLKTLKKKK